MKGDLYQYSEDGTVKQVAPEKPAYNNPNWFAHEIYETTMAALNPTSIPVEPKPDWKDGQIVERGVDFEIFHQWYVGFNGQQPTWQDCTGATYFTYYEDKRRLIARPIAKEQAKPNCSQHKKDLFGEKNMKVVAEAICGLHYETLHELFSALCDKFEFDATNDSMGGRTELSKHLFIASELCNDITVPMYKAWQISKPFMK